MAEWIDVKERLPDEPGFYIVWVDDPVGPHADACHYHSLRAQGGWHRFYVTHWQPMLEPPAGQRTLASPVRGDWR